MNELKEILLKRLNKDAINSILLYIYPTCNKCSKLFDDNIYIKHFELSPKWNHTDSDIIFHVRHLFMLIDDSKKYMKIKYKKHTFMEKYYPWKPIIKECPTVKSFQITRFMTLEPPTYYILHPYVFHYILDKFKCFIYCSKGCMNNHIFKFECNAPIHGNKCLEGCDSNERVKIYNIYMEFQHIFNKLDQDILNNYKLYSKDKKSWNLDYDKIIREL